jgi:hypothetical protein
MKWLAKKYSAMMKVYNSNIIYCNYHQACNVYIHCCNTAQNIIKFLKASKSKFLNTFCSCHRTKYAKFPACAKKTYPTCGGKYIYYHYDCMQPLYMRSIYRGKQIHDIITKFGCTNELHIIITKRCIFL